MRLIVDVRDICCRLVGEDLEGGGLLFFLRLTRRLNADCVRIGDNRLQRSTRFVVAVSVVFIAIIIVITVFVTFILQNWHILVVASFAVGLLILGLLRHF